MKKSFLCISLLSLCLLSGCKQWFDAQPDPDESKIAAEKMHLHIRNGCVNIISSSHLSIDEK